MKHTCGICGRSYRTKRPFCRRCRTTISPAAVETYEFGTRDEMRAWMKKNRSWLQYVAPVYHRDKKWMVTV